MSSKLLLGNIIFDTAVSLSEILFGFERKTEVALLVFEQRSKRPFLWKTVQFCSLQRKNYFKTGSACTAFGIYWT